MNTKRLNIEKGANVSHKNEEANELYRLVKKTKLQDKLLKKMIEEIRNAPKEN